MMYTMMYTTVHCRVILYFMHQSSSASIVAFVVVRVSPSPFRRARAFDHIVRHRATDDKNFPPHARHTKHARTPIVLLGFATRRPIVVYTS